MRKARSTANGVERADSQVTMATSTRARRKPTIGDTTMASSVFDNPLHTAAEIPALAMPAPTRPPISACELDEGMPRPQVIRFQTMAPINAAKITVASTTLGSMIPVPMVLATCRPNTVKAMKLKKAAQNTAYCGRSTRVETMVAIELAASCRPFRKSKASATAIRPTRMGRPSVTSTVPVPALYLFDHDAVDLIGDVVEAVGDFLQVIVDLDADDEVHGAAVTVFQIKLLHADVVEVVDAAFQLAQFLRDLRQQRHVGADRLQQRQRACDQIGAFDDQLPHLAHRRLELTHLKQHHSLCRLLHLVDGIVHRSDQVLDV